MSIAPGDYTKAVIKHWLHGPDGLPSGKFSGRAEFLREEESAYEVDHEYEQK